MYPSLFTCVEQDDSYTSAAIASSLRVPQPAITTQKYATLAGIAIERAISNAKIQQIQRYHLTFSHNFKEFRKNSGVFFVFLKVGAWLGISVAQPTLPFWQ